MENTTCSWSENRPGLLMLLTVLIAAAVAYKIYCLVRRQLRSRQDSQKTTYYDDRNEFVPTQESPMYIPPSVPREFGNKRVKNKKRREAQQERVHPWMMGTLKGHTGLVNDMDFSSNGRYLASCADDENLRETRKHVQSSGHMYKKKESKKKTSSSLQADCKESQSFTRREDKETGKASKSWNQESSRYSYDYHATSSSHEAFTSDTSSNDDIPDESQQQMMFLGDVPAACLMSAISKYALSPRELFEHGYPLESLRFPGYARINNITYPSGPKIESDSGQYSNSSSSDNSESSSDNEKNFGSESSPDKKNGPDDRDSFENEERCDSESSSDNEKSLDDKKSSGHEQSSDSESSSENEKSCDSGSNSSNEKSPESKKSCNRKGSSNNKNCSDGEMRLDKRRLDKEKSRDNDSSSDSERSPDSKKKFGVGSKRSLERTCVRCEKIFYVDWNGEYLNAERCIYHCGKLHNRMTTDSWYYTCCNQSRFSRGCAEWTTHVWTGLVPGINEPLAGYVYTMPSPIFRHDNNYGVYAMDCEMCFTVQGLELARVTLVNLYGQIEYDTLVQPSSEVIDYNTKFSGITEEHMSSNITKTLPEVQNDLLNFIYAETILMGHGLGNDLRALHLIHRNVIDTSVMFPHYLGLPYRNGLKTLARRVLNRRIQEETHNSFEDAHVVMDLVLRKVKYEWQTLLSGR